MTIKVRTEGSWPSRITIRRGWARAFARPWNHDPAHGFIRLDRGGHDFLADATSSLAEFGVTAAFSPALYPTSTRLWARAGFEEVNRLRVMERSLARPIAATPEVTEEDDIDWVELESIDEAAFEGFWRMSIPGLMEAMDATSRSAVLTRRESTSLAGYTIVGSQWGVSYLQRIGVHREFRGRGYGAEMVRAAVSWARRTTSNVMVLNVRDQNVAARNLYAREGFTATGTHLRIMRHRL